MGMVGTKRNDGIMPVRQALEREVAEEVRRQGIVVWLDKDEHYTSFVDALAARSASGDLPYPVAAFRGSFVEMDDLGFAEEPFDLLKSSSLKYNLDMLRGRLETVGLLSSSHSDL